MLSIVVFIYNGCSDDDKDNTPAATCSDGIQNQGETGIDCGGPCTSCPTNVCTGNGSNDYFPMALGNYYSFHESGFPDYTDTITGTEVFDSLTYFAFERPDRFHFDPPSFTYYREASGVVYEYNDGLNVEYVLIPANPTVNQTWNIGSESRKVISLNETKTVGTCTYTELLRIDQFYSSGNLAHSTYYKKGVGKVTRIFPAFGAESLFTLHLN